MKQLTIMTNDRVGILADISYILGKAKMSIIGVTAEAYEGNAIINLMVKDDKKASGLLAANGYKVLETDLIMIKVKDEPGALSSVSKRLKDAKINVESLFLIMRCKGHSIGALKVDKPKAAKRILADCLFECKE